MEALAEVNDPLYMFSRVDVDADGEAEETVSITMEDIKPTLAANGRADAEQDLKEEMADIDNRTDIDHDTLDE